LACGKGTEDAVPPLLAPARSDPSPAAPAGEGHRGQPLPKEPIPVARPATAPPGPPIPALGVVSAWQQAPHLSVPLPLSVLNLRAQLLWDDGLRLPVRTNVVARAAQPQQAAQVPAASAKPADEAPNASSEQCPLGQWRVLKFTNRTEVGTPPEP